MEATVEWQLVADYFTTLNIIIAFILLLTLCNFIELYQFRNMPPGPRLKILSFIGNLLNFDGKNPGHSLLMATSSLVKKYGKVFSMRIGGYKVVFVEDSKSVKEVLVKRSADYAGRPPFYSWSLLSSGGKNIVFGNCGPAWRFHRKLFTAALRKYLTNHQLVEERISEQADRLLQYIDEQNENDFDPAGTLRVRVGDISSRITFGKFLDSSKPEFHEFIELTDCIISDIQLYATNTLLDFFPLAKYFPFKCYRRTREIADRSIEILRRPVKAQENELNFSDDVDTLTGSLLKEKAIAAREISTEHKSTLLTDEYILNTVKDMFAAGYETTSNTLRWALAFLVNNPETQQEVQNQMDEIVGRDRMPNLDDRSKLPLLQATIMEVQRLANVVTYAPHYTLKDTTLGNYRIPKDTVVMVNLLCVHTDPVCWQNPMKFDPQRHIDSNGQIITNSGNFLPFAAGRRVCAGESLAKVELFLFLSWMLHKFTFLPAEGEGLPDLTGVEGFTRFPAAYKIRAVKRQ